MHLAKVSCDFIVKCLIKRRVVGAARAVWPEGHADLLVELFPHAFHWRDGKDVRNGGNSGSLPFISPLTPWCPLGPSCHLWLCSAFGAQPVLHPLSFPVLLRLLIDVSRIEPLFQVKHHDRCCVKGGRGEGGMNECVCILRRTSWLFTETQNFLIILRGWGTTPDLPYKTLSRTWAF